MDSTQSTLDSEVSRPNHQEHGEVCCVRSNVFPSRPTPMALPNLAKHFQVGIATVIVHGRVGSGIGHATGQALSRIGWESGGCGTGAPCRAVLSRTRRRARLTRGRTRTAGYTSPRRPARTEPALVRRRRACAGTENHTSATLGHTLKCRHPREGTQTHRETRQK